MFVKPVCSPKQLLSLLLPSLLCSCCIHRRKLNCRLCNGAGGPQGLSVPESSAGHQNICEGTGLPQGCGCSHSPPPWHPRLLRAYTASLSANQNPSVCKAAWWLGSFQLPFPLPGTDTQTLPPTRTEPALRGPLTCAGQRPCSFISSLN